jgi:hypothetical protein
MEQNFLMSATTKTLYDTDFAEWSSRTAEMLRNGRLAELDLENVAEEIESLGRSEHAAVRSQIKRLLMHKVKQIIQPERDGTSWRLSIADARQTILDHIEDSPSLRKYLRDNLQRFYRDAVELALIEMEQSAAAGSVPRECPWTLDALLKD